MVSQRLTSAEGVLLGTTDSAVTDAASKGNPNQLPAAKRSRTRSWLLVAPSIFMLAWGGNHFTPLLHTYQTLGMYVPWQSNLLLGMYVFGLIPGLLAASSISDRVGRKIVMNTGILVSVLGSLLLACGLDSFLLLCLGRVLAGIGVGVAMSVGTTWMKELSGPPYILRPRFAAGARRPALTLTLGFGIGAAVTGSLAQWGPAPTVLPFLIHLGLSLPALVFSALAPESRSSAVRRSSPLIRSVGSAKLSPSFVRVVLPAAPWVFAAAGVAYAIIPASVEDRLGNMTTLYATVLTVLTLGAGALVQGLVPALERWTGGLALLVGLGLMVAGMVSAVFATYTEEPALGVFVAVLLGAAYGICVVAGLMQVQAMASPEALARLTGLYYALTYLGFLSPTGLALLLPVLPYPASLGGLAAICLACFIVVAVNLKRKQPDRGRRRAAA